MSIALYKQFFYDMPQADLLESCSKTISLENHDYDEACLSKTSFEQISTTNIFYFHQKKLKHLLFILENQNTYLDKTMCYLDEAGFQGVVERETKYLKDLLTAPSTKRQICTKDLLQSKKALSASAKKQGAKNILFLKKDDHVISYPETYEKMKPESVAAYINLDPRMNLIYVGFCVPKQNLLA